MLAEVSMSMWKKECGSVFTSSEYVAFDLIIDGAQLK
jgi:hypothetical protein